MGPGIELAAQVAVGRVLNSLPEGLLIALSAWLLLRVMGRQNSGTRFAVWLIALLGVVALPFLGRSGSGATAVSLHAPVTVPALWAVVFAAVWIAAACFATARIAAGMLQVRRIRRNSREIAELEPALREVLDQSRRPVKLLVSDEVRVPAAIGFFTPAIVLPTWTLRDLSADELRPILIHEMAHLRRRDDWTNLLQKAVRAALPFHPAIWWIDARLSLEREMACDDAVVAETGNPRGYAGCLIGLLEKSCARRGWTMAQAAVSKAREATVRIARILQAGTPATTRMGRSAVVLAGAACVTCCGVLIEMPRLLVFSPEKAPIEAAIRPVSEPALTPPVVVPAAYHPAETRGLVHKAMLQRTISPHRPAMRRAIAIEKKPLHAPQVVMTSYSMPPMPKQAAARPMMITFEISQPEPAGAKIGDAPTARANGPQSAANPAATESMQGRLVQVQTLEIVDGDGSGFQIRVYQLVLTPAQNTAEAARSI